MFKFRGCLVCQVGPSPSQICKEVQKPPLWKGAGKFFFWMNAQYIYVMINSSKISIHRFIRVYIYIYIYN